jgi:hypothetical protein
MREQADLANAENSARLLSAPRQTLYIRLYEFNHRQIAGAKAPANSYRKFVKYRRNNNLFYKFLWRTGFRLPVGALCKP